MQQAARRGLATRPPLDGNAYAVLGVPRSVSAAELKSAYRKLARAWHPDVSTRKDAKEIFPHITRSYEILSDEQQRHAYDFVLNHRIPFESPETFQAFYARAVQSAQALEPGVVTARLSQRAAGAIRPLSAREGALGQYTASHINLAAPPPTRKCCF